MKMTQNDTTEIIMLYFKEKYNYAKLLEHFDNKYTYAQIRKVIKGHI